MLYEFHLLNFSSFNSRSSTRVVWKTFLWISSKGSASWRGCLYSGWEHMASHAHNWRYRGKLPPDLQRLCQLCLDHSSYLSKVHVQDIWWYVCIILLIWFVIHVYFGLWWKLTIPDCWCIDPNSCCFFRLLFQWCYWFHGLLYRGTCGWFQESN